MPLQSLPFVMRAQIELMRLGELRRISRVLLRRNGRDRKPAGINPAAHAVHQPALELRESRPRPATRSSIQSCAPSATRIISARSLNSSGVAKARRTAPGPLRAPFQSPAPAIRAGPACTPSPTPLPKPSRIRRRTTAPPSPRLSPNQDIRERHTQQRTAQWQAAATRPQPALIRLHSSGDSVSALIHALNAIRGLKPLAQRGDALRNDVAGSVLFAPDRALQLQRTYDLACARSAADRRTANSSAASSSAVPRATAFHRPRASSPQTNTEEAAHPPAPAMNRPLKPTHSVEPSQLRSESRSIFSIHRRLQQRGFTPQSSGEGNSQR